MVHADDAGRHGLALAELLEGEHAACAEIDPQSTLGGLELELDRAVLDAKPAARQPAQPERLTVLCRHRLAVLPAELEQCRLLGIEPGAGDRLDLGLFDRRRR